MCSVVDVAVRRRGLYVCGLLLLLLFYLRGCLQIMTKHWLTSSFCMGRWGEGGDLMTQVCVQCIIHSAVVFMDF